MQNSPKSFTYELTDGRDLLFAVKRLLQQGGTGWQEVGEVLPSGHVEYRPVRNNPMRSGYNYRYQKAGLNLNLYFPEKEFNRLSEMLDGPRVEKLRAAFQESLPKRSGYVIQEFKIRGVLDGPEITKPSEDQPPDSSEESG